MSVCVGVHYVCIYTLTLTQQTKQTYVSRYARARETDTMTLVVDIADMIRFQGLSNE